jgi:hypothetical protein
MGAFEDAREAAAFDKGVPAGGDGRLWTIGQLISIDAERATVTIHGGQPVELPFVPNTYTDINTVYVLLDPLRGGSGQLVLGPCGEVPDDDPDVAPLPPVPVVPPATITAHRLILPTASGTWSAKWSRYAAWQPTRYGGSTTLYQGSKYGSGTLTGVAVYGNQIVNLGATSITAMTLTSVLATVDTGTVTYKGTASGTMPAGIPVTVGSGTASGFGSVSLVASGIAEAMRVGAIKGLVTIGTDYLGVYGRAKANGMALSVTYTKPA